MQRITLTKKKGRGLEMDAEKAIQYLNYTLMNVKHIFIKT